MDGRMQELIVAVTEKTGMTSAAFREKIKAKQSELSGLVSEEGAAYIVANELGVKTQNRRIVKEIKVKDIALGMRSVNTTGRITRIIGPREFTTKGGAKSKVTNFDIVDSTGGTRIVLWDTLDAERVEKNETTVNDVVSVKNGYVREGLNNRLEVHIGSKGTFIVNPKGVKEEDFPKSSPMILTGSPVVKISDVRPLTPASVIGKVTNTFGVREFNKDGRQGKVGNLVLKDESGTLRLVLWNEQADLVNDLKVGDVLKVENGYAKEGMRGVELQANQRTKIEKNPAGVEVEVPDQQASERTRIADLKDGDTYKEIKGVVVSVPSGDNMVHDMCPKCNKKMSGVCPACGSSTPNKLLIVNAMLDDGSGVIRAAFFRDNAEKLLGMKTDEIVNSQEAAKTKMDNLIGKEIILNGRTKHNDMFDRIEFQVYDVQNVNPVKEAEKIMKVA